MNSRVSPRLINRRLVSALVLVLCALSLPASATAAAPGRFERSFGQNGIKALPSDTRLLDVAARPGGRFVAVGETGRRAGKVRLLVAALTANGQLDRNFHGGKLYRGAVGTVGRAVAVQPNGRIVVAGTATDKTGQTQEGMIVWRFMQNGAGDHSLSGDGKAVTLASVHGQALALALQPNGRIVLAGSAELPNGADDFDRVAVARFRANGSRDRGFGSEGAEVLDLGRLSLVQDVAVGRDGKIVVAGSQRNDLQTTQALVARLRPDGGLDGSFATRGLFLHQYAQGAALSTFRSLVLQRHGRILLAGTALSAVRGADALVVRLNSRGRPDGRFGEHGVIYLSASVNANQYSQSPLPGAYSIAISHGDIVLTGYHDVSGATETALWGLHAGGSPDRRFGTGGHTFAKAGVFYSGLNAVIAAGRHLVAVGTESDPLTRRDTGIVARYGAPR